VPVRPTRSIIVAADGARAINLDEIDPGFFADPQIDDRRVRFERANQSSRAQDRS
jgi:hypothetical protein